MNKTQSPKHGSIEPKEFRRKYLVGVPIWSTQYMYLKQHVLSRALKVLSVVAAIFVVKWVIQKMDKKESPDHGNIESKDFIEPVIRGRMPAWSEREKFFKQRAKARVLQVLSVIAAILVVIWVIQKPITPAIPRDPSEGDLVAALIPALAAALSINLFIELVITLFEQYNRSMVAYLGRGLRWLKHAEIEVVQSRQFLGDVSAKYNAELQNLRFGQTSVTTLTDEIKAKIEAMNDLMGLAQQRLENAELNLDRLVDSRSYQRFKWVVTIYFSILSGLLISAATSLQIFSITGVQLDNPRIDMILTGLFIGGLVYPVHQVIGNIWDILTKLAK